MNTDLPVKTPMSSLNKKLTLFGDNLPLLNHCENFDENDSQRPKSIEGQLSNRPSS
jgi:hypothetical protein